MKSDHRHELQQNELGKLARKVQPWFALHGMQVVAGLAAALVVTGGVIWWMNYSLQAGSAGWTKLSIAEKSEDFATVADANAENLAGAWARLRAAELNLDNGILESFTDRELALADLNRAKADFEKVLASRMPLPPAVEERALLGLARCLETLCDGDVTPVVEAYQRLLTRYPDSVYKNHVEQRIRELQTDAAKSFYAWFHKEKPKPPEFRKPQDAKPQDAKTTVPVESELPSSTAAPNEKSEPAESAPAEAAP